MHRFLNRVWRLFEGKVTVGSGSSHGQALGDYSKSDRDLLRKVHLTISKVTFDIERFHFNTAVSAIMELANTMQAYRDAHGPQTSAYSEAATNLLLLLAPMAPHITEEIWQASGGTDSIHRQPWPAVNEELAAADVVTVVVQINGKVRDKVELPADVGQDEAINAAMQSERVKHYLNGNEPQKVHYVAGRLINIVV